MKLVTAHPYRSGGVILAVALLLAGPVLAGMPGEAGPEGATRSAQGETAWQSARYAAAAEHYEQAQKKLRGTWFEDDAALARLLAWTAAGDDAKAAELYGKWSDRYGDSPLRAEADLAQAWNRLRAEDIEGAGKVLRKMTERDPWSARQPQVRTLAAALEIAAGRPRAALEILNDRPDPLVEDLPALGLLLSAHCHETLGDVRSAALAAQELLRQHPDSDLCGYAWLTKGRVYGAAEDFRDADRAFTDFAAKTSRADLRGEAEFLAAECRYLGGDENSGMDAMADLADRHTGADLAARAHFALGEMRWRRGEFDTALLDFDRVLAGYFDHELAGSARYRLGRCLDALGRTGEANAAYQAVAAGHPYAPEAPAAVYLAGVGLLEQDNPEAAAPYFQLVLDRYAGHGAEYVFTSPEHQELVEASLCLLEYSYYSSGQFGRLSGSAHLALQKMPPSGSIWRAYALLLDADALAAQQRFPESQATLDRLLTEFPDHAVGVRANRLLAWTYARQGREDLAIETERTMLARYSAQDDRENLAAARLTMAHSLFNAKDFEAAAAAYAEFLGTDPDHVDAPLAWYQQGLCFQRLGREGDAVDVWSRITKSYPGSDWAGRAWQRSGDVYFQTGHFDEARTCYHSLLADFPGDEAQAAALLRLGRCDFNEGDAQAALDRFRELRSRYPESNESADVEPDLTQALYALGTGGQPACLEELAREHPDSPLAPEARFELARQALEAGQQERAGQLFGDLVGRYPDYSAADRAAFLAVEAGAADDPAPETLAAWQRFLEHFPASDLAPTARFRIASLRFEGGEYHRAARDFEQVLTLEAGDEIHAAALYNLALARRINGELAEAERALRRYRDADYDLYGREAEVARALGEICEEQGRYMDAADEYAAVLELAAQEDTAVEMSYRAGLCLSEAGHPKEALASFERSVACVDKSNPYRLSALARIAALREQSGELKQALAAYRDLIAHAGDATLVGAARERAHEIETVLND